MTTGLRLLDLGWVSGLRSQTIWHAVAERMRPGDLPSLLLMSPVDPYVSIGYHRSIGEIDRDAARRRGLPVYRRRVGGGPVYCDANQLFFQVVAPAASAPAVLDRAWRRFVGPAVEAFRALGVPAELAEGNDVLAHDCKVCGTGAARIGDAVVFVGNVIFSFDYEAMVDVLAVPPEVKEAAELLMRRFLATVGDAAGRPVPREKAASALVSAYEAAFGPARPEALTGGEEEAATVLEIEGYRVPLDRLYHREDGTWVRVEGALVRVGMDVLGQETAGDLAQLALAPPGTVLSAGDEMGSLEAQKYVGALRCPVGGTVVEVNERALVTPRLVNEDPYGDGWLLVIEPAAPVREDAEGFVSGGAVEPWFREKLAEYRAMGSVAE
jgi:lipoate-protein ligase A